MKKLTIVTDFNNSLSDMPGFFKTFADLIIVTGKPLDDLDRVEEKLEGWGIRDYKLCMCPFEWSNNETYAAMRNWKIDEIVKIAPDIFFDDNLRTILSVQAKSPKTIGLLVIKNEYSMYELRPVSKTDKLAEVMENINEKTD